MAIDLFSIGRFTFHGYGLMIALGFIAAIAYGTWQCKKDGLNDDEFFNLAICVLIFGWLGGKIMFTIVEFKSFLQSPMSVISSEGFVVYGGIITGLITIIVFCKVRKLDFLRYIDVMVAAVAINQCLGRVGCFLAGCCYGRETDSWIGVVFPEGCLAPAGVKLLPTQLFSAAANLLMFIVLFLIINYGDIKNKTFSFSVSNTLESNTVELNVTGQNAEELNMADSNTDSVAVQADAVPGNNSKKIKGIAFSVYLAGYAIGRSIIECFRADSRGAVGGLSTSQFISLFTGAAGIALLIYFIKNPRFVEIPASESHKNIDETKHNQ